MRNAIIRIIVLLVAVVNALLTAKGNNPIPLDENEITEILSYVFDIAMCVWAWWKNAPITRPAQKAQRDLEAYKVLEGGE